MISTIVPLDNITEIRIVEDVLLGKYIMITQGKKEIKIHNQNLLNLLSTYFEKEWKGW